MALSSCCGYVGAWEPVREWGVATHRLFFLFQHTPVVSAKVMKGALSQSKGDQLCG
jgi:hypothetical protein